METSEDTPTRTPTAGRGRPSLPVGEHGSIETSAWVVDAKTGTKRRRRPQGDGRRPVTHWTAEAYLMTGTGRRRVSARGATSAAAEAALRLKLSPPEPDELAEAMSDGRARLSDSTPLGDVLDAWMTDPATISARSVGTIVRYRHAVEHTIKARKIGPGTLGAAPLTKITPRVVSLFLSDLSPAVAKTCRAILRQALTFAVSHGATVPSTNGAFAMLAQRVDRRGHATVIDPTTRTIMTSDEVDAMLSALDADPSAAATDVPDVFRFLAGTGCRTSEALALAWSQLDLTADEPTVTINATVNAKGERQGHTKTRAGVRKLALPASVVAMLQARRERALPGAALVFPSAARGTETVLWTSNFTGVARAHLNRLGYPGVSGRTLRRYVATELDKADFTARQIADQLGHSKVSVTLDTYQDRVAAGPVRAASVLS